LRNFLNEIARYFKKIISFFACQHFYKKKKLDNILGGGIIEGRIATGIGLLLTKFHNMKIKDL
jgi:hypothetical protein